jgi:hypothetical protein
MTVQEEQIFKIENELNGARRDLRDTMSAIDAKVEHAEEEPRPDRLIERYPRRRVVSGGRTGSSRRLEYQESNRWAGDASRPAGLCDIEGPPKGLE